MKREIDVKVNGETYSIVVDTRETLLDETRLRGDDHRVGVLDQ